MRKKLFQMLSYGVMIYQRCLAPYIGRRCRFEPSCSMYAMHILKKSQTYRGLWLIVKRVGRCHPWCIGGYDPPPDP